MTHEELKNCIGQYRELKKDLWWVNRWGVQKIDGYDFGVSYNDFAGHWQFSWNDPDNEFKVADVEDIFETKEEAEWHREFGCIERTERLVLPTWEEFKENRLKNNFYGVNFIAKASGCYCVLYISNNTDRIMLYDVACFEEVFSGEPNKENYTLACRKAKELFLGESNVKD